MIKETSWEKVDFSNAQPVNAYVINSVICVPEDGSEVTVDKTHPKIELKGYAIGDGQSGGKITKVELSFDEGKSWNEAQLVAQEDKDPSKCKVFSWTIWTY